MLNEDIWMVQVNVDIAPLKLTYYQHFTRYNNRKKSALQRYKEKENVYCLTCSSYTLWWSCDLEVQCWMDLQTFSSCCGQHQINFISQGKTSHHHLRLLLLTRWEVSAFFLLSYLYFGRCLDKISTLQIARNSLQGLHKVWTAPAPLSFRCEGVQS